MKTYKLTITLALISMQLSAQEIMKVELKEGKTIEYKVDNIKRVYFDDASTPNEVIVTPSSVSMYYDGTKQLSAPGATSWTTSNEYVATVDENGLVKGMHIGTTEIMASNGVYSDKCTVTIKPKYSLYDTPLLNWGDSRQQMKNSETHELLKEDENGLYYKYDFGSTTCILAYGFKEGKLNYAMAMMVPFNATLFSNTGYYIMERYQPLYQDGYNYWFMDAMKIDDAKSIVKYDISESFTMESVSVSYADASGLKISESRSRSADNFTNELINKEQIKELFRSLQ